MHTNRQNINADFTCKNCGCYVSACSALSGVVHRNHCPYCLHSRHVDLFRAGDRLCACKSLMAPVGLTLKRSWDKYAAQRGGEVMLVHRCTGCGELAINRIAADDDLALILAILEDGSGEQQKIQRQCHAKGIRLINPTERLQILTRLLGDTGCKTYQHDLNYQVI